MQRRPENAKKLCDSDEIHLKLYKSNAVSLKANMLKNHWFPEGLRQLMARCKEGARRVRGAGRVFGQGGLGRRAQAHSG